MIDLTLLAQQAESAHRDVNCSFGMVRVYHVPDPLLLAVAKLDYPEPELPVVRMKLASGGFQSRAAKKGDTEFNEWQRERKAYEDALFELRFAAGFVYALKDIDWSQYDLTKPPPNEQAIAHFNDTWPDNELLRKKAWLDWTVLFKRSDQEKILGAMSDLRGENEPDDVMVDEVKKNSASS